MKSVDTLKLGLHLKLQSSMGSSLLVNVKVTHAYNNCYIIIFLIQYHIAIIIII